MQKYRGLSLLLIAFRIFTNTKKHLFVIKIHLDLNTMIKRCESANHKSLIIKIDKEKKP